MVATKNVYWGRNSNSEAFMFLSDFYFMSGVALCNSCIFSPSQQSPQQDVCVQPQAVRMEGAGGHEDAQVHVRSRRARRQDPGGRWSQ